MLLANLHHLWHRGVINYTIIFFEIKLSNSLITINLVFNRLKIYASHKSCKIFSMQI